MRGRGADVVAGAVASCVVVPQAIAYASLAGLPVQVGLYAALVPMLVYALLGSSRPLSVSVTSTISIITATAVAGSEDPAQTAAVLAMLAGGLLAIAGIVRLGFLADLISLPILTGYKAGIGLVILSGQRGKVLGIPVDGDGSSKTSPTCCGVSTRSTARRWRWAARRSCCCWRCRASCPACRRRWWPSPHVVHEEDGIAVLRPRVRLYFANVRRTRDRVVAVVRALDPPPRVVILDVVAVPDLDITAVAALHGLADDLRAHGAELWVASLTPVERRMVERYPADNELPVFATPAEAVRVARR